MYWKNGEDELRIPTNKIKVEIEMRKTKSEKEMEKRTSAGLTKYKILSKSFFNCSRV
jgi:hypothetical protein